MILYQYRGPISNEEKFGYLANLLKKGDLKFTKPSEFNDPFDCCPTQLGEASVNAFPHAVGDMMNQSVRSATSMMHGIVCLTPHPDKMLMWSHYGDQHRSVCIGFDSQVLLDKAPRNSEENPLYDDIVEVVYTSTRPDAGGKEQYFHKSDEWSYEEERRIISCAKKGQPTWGAGVWVVPTGAIKEIVLGARMPSELEQKVVDLANAVNVDIAIRKAVLHMNTFDILIEPFEDQPNIAPMSGVVMDPNGQWKNT